MYFIRLRNENAVKYEVSSVPKAAFRTIKM